MTRISGKGIICSLGDSASELLQEASLCFVYPPVSSMKRQCYARKSLRVFYGLFPVRSSSDTNEKCGLKLSHCETLDYIPLIHTFPPKSSTQDLEKKKAEPVTLHFLSLNQDTVSRAYPWRCRGKKLADGVNTQALWDLSTFSEVSNLPVIREQAGKYRSSRSLIIKHDQEAVVLCNVDNNTI